MKKKSKMDLPEKVCIVCGRPFTWRKKWERDWDRVKYCSKKCIKNKGQTESSGSGTISGLQTTKV
ncbi:DUF2256 domain-containing protein [Robertkochia flava]|uniref:DUF2256 domain-containing protein n=1 Tax=Robertkochia flava TaxID=3447986 RepID=UPI003978130A